MVYGVALFNFTRLKLGVAVLSTHGVRVPMTVAGQTAHEVRSS